MFNQKLVASYSTTEHVVGMWKGKPLYSKEFELTSTGGTNHNMTNLDNYWVDMGHTYILKTTGRRFPGSYYAQDADYAHTSINSTQILLDGTIANFSKEIVTILYTKTTD